MEKLYKKRDIRFDILKGIATIFVVIGHVIQYNFKDYHNSMIFNIIWSIQIPLFMVVSGYFSLSNKKNKSFIKQLFHYLWPCVTYFVALSTIYHYKNPILSAYNLLWHLEGTLWYLFVLAFLNSFNFLAKNISNKLANKKSGGVIYSLIFFGEVAFFATPSLKFGLTFLGIKYILYYSIFHWLGYMWHYTKENITVIGFKINYDALFVLFFVIYFLIICNINLYLVNDNYFGILTRLIASFCGIYIICFYVFKANNNSELFKMIAIIGENSLEIYYIHCILIRIFTPEYSKLISIEGLAVLMLGTFFILLTSYVISKLIKKSNYLYAILFGTTVHN